MKKDRNTMIFKISIVNMTQTYSPWLKKQKATEHKPKIKIG